MWELLLHRLLLRSSPKSRGRSRHNRDTLSNRFAAFERGDYQFLVHGLEKACRVAAVKRRRAPKTESDTLKRVEALLMKGRFSKAFCLLDSKGQWDMRDPAIVSQLDAKHGPRVHKLPGKLPDDLPNKVVLETEKLAQTYRELKPLAGTGPSGYRNEYLQCLTHGNDDGPDRGQGCRASLPLRSELRQCRAPCMVLLAHMCNHNDCTN